MSTIPKPLYELLKGSVYSFVLCRVQAAAPQVSGGRGLMSIKKGTSADAKLTPDMSASSAAATAVRVAALAACCALRGLMPLRLLASSESICCNFLVKWRICSIYRKTDIDRAVDACYVGALMSDSCVARLTQHQRWTQSLVGQNFDNQAQHIDPVSIHDGLTYFA